MKKISIFVILMLVSISIVLAHAGEDDGHDELIQQMQNTQMSGHSMQGGSEFSHQVQMILPFSHFAEGHWFAGIILVIMWIALVHGVYSLVAKFKK